VRRESYIRTTRTRRLEVMRLMVTLTSSFPWNLMSEARWRCGAPGGHRVAPGAPARSLATRYQTFKTLNTAAAIAPTLRT
jgi:hypothetical protein